MKSYRFLVQLLLLGFVSAQFSCSVSDEKKKPPALLKPSLPVVTDSSKQLLFSWFEENEAKTSTDIAEIPDSVKKEVRVQDLKVPPEKRDPNWLFLVDLTQKKDKGKNKGKYKVVAVERDKYEMKRHPTVATAENSTNNSSTVASVVMYATPYCPHCKTARRWLLEQKIPYKEIDLNKDSAAAAALAQKGQAQGVSTSGVPIFEINGRLIPGFDPASIKKALSAPPLNNQIKKQRGPQNPVPTPTPVHPQAPAGNSPSTITI